MSNTSGPMSQIRVCVGLRAGLGPTPVQDPQCQVQPAYPVQHAPCLGFAVHVWLAWWGVYCPRRTGWTWHCRQDRGCVWGPAWSPDSRFLLPRAVPNPAHMLQAAYALWLPCLLHELQALGPACIVRGARQALCAGFGMTQSILAPEPACRAHRCST